MPRRNATDSKKRNRRPNYPDNISENTRPARAGKAFGATVVENVHLMFLDDNALEYLNALTKVLNKEFRRRKKQWRDKEGD